jgi:hypothetical protein
MDYWQESCVFVFVRRFIGVMQGISQPPAGPFHVITGTSAGALNAASLAALTPAVGVCSASMEEYQR